MITGSLREQYRAAGLGGTAIFVAAALITLTGIGAILVRGGGSVEPLEVASPQPLPRAAVPVGDPIRVRIPAIGVVAPLVPLGINDDGTLEVPRYEEAGWYADGTRPGDRGPAVIAAHLDSTTGPAVFHRLEELKPGEVVHVDYGDGTVSFAVRESRSFLKSQFPTQQVYGPTEEPELRLITCDGTFDRRAASYNSNLVVWADMVGPPVVPPPT